MKSKDSTNNTCFPRFKRGDSVKVTFTEDMKVVSQVQRANSGIGRGYDYMMTDGSRWPENELDQPL